MKKIIFAILLLFLLASPLSFALPTNSQVGGAYFYYNNDGTMNRITAYAIDGIKTFECDYKFSNGVQLSKSSYYWFSHDSMLKINTPLEFGQDSCSLEMKSNGDVLITVVSDDMIAEPIRYQVNGRVKP